MRPVSFWPIFPRARLELRVGQPSGSAGELSGENGEFEFKGRPQRITLVEGEIHAVSLRIQDLPDAP